MCICFINASAYASSTSGAPAISCFAVSPNQFIAETLIARNDKKKAFGGFLLFLDHESKKLIHLRSFKKPCLISSWKLIFNFWKNKISNYCGLLIDLTSFIFAQSSFICYWKDRTIERLIGRTCKYYSFYNHRNRQVMSPLLTNGYCVYVNFCHKLFSQK